MSKRSDEIRNKYIQNPPEGMTADDIRHMSEDDLLDMDYFLNETMSLVKTFLELKASISSKTYRLLVVPAKLRALFISSYPKVRTFL